MNNNDPMKRFGYIVFSICLFALSACTSHEQMDQEEGIVKVSMGLPLLSPMMMRQPVRSSRWHLIMKT